MPNRPGVEVAVCAVHCLVDASTPRVQQVAVGLRWRGCVARVEPGRVGNRGSRTRRFWDISSQTRTPMGWRLELKPTPNMVTRSLGSMLFLRESALPPSDAEWNQCLRLLSEHRSDWSKVKVLVVTEGGGPTVAQRKSLSSLVEGHPIRVAVVTESTKVRFIVSSAALFLREIASFSPRELHLAYAHLKMSVTEQTSADKILDEMSAAVGIPSRRSYPTAQKT